MLWLELGAWREMARMTLNCGCYANWDGVGVDRVKGASVSLDWDPGEHQQIQHGDSDGLCLYLIECNMPRTML
jgi:hypothetical protein